MRKGCARSRQEFQPHPQSSAGQALLLLLLTLVNMFTGLWKLLIGPQSADKSVSPSLTQLGWAGAGLPGGAQPAATAAPPSLQNGAAAAPLPLEGFSTISCNMCTRFLNCVKGYFSGL